MEETENIVDVHEGNFKIYDKLDRYIENIRQKKQRHRIIVHLNICSMRKNWDELKDIVINESDIDVMIITEINIKEHENIVYSLKGYKMIVYNRENKTRGGGIGIYIKENIEINNTIMGNSTGGMYEYIQISLELDHKKTTIIAIYRPPDGDVNAFVEDIQSRLLEIKEKSNVILIGDINIDLNDTNGMKVSNYRNVMAQNGMENCIFSNTREVMRDNKLVVSCIDHVYERYHAEVFSAVIQLRVSDHYMVAISFLAPSHQEENRIHNKIMYNESNLKNDVLKVEWGNDKEMNDTVELYDSICSKFNTVYNRNIKSKCKPEKIRKNKSWVTKEIIDKIRIRDNAFKKWKNTPSNVKYRDEYKKLRNKVNKEIKQQKYRHQISRIECYKDNMKKIWKEINNIVGRTVLGNIDDTINTFLGKAYKTEQILEAFVDEFSKGIERIIHKCPLVLINEENIDKRSMSRVSILIPKITEINVKNIITNMKSSKAPGIDAIRIQDLQLCKSKLAPALVKLINTSIKNGVLPQGLKTSIIRPIYKGGAHSDYKNYRPIAILSSIEKIMEVYITNKLNKYLETHKIINEDQHGFQKGKSTVSLLKNYVDYVNGNLNTNKIIITIFIDLKKAFDTINHSILIKRLENIGIRGRILEWFKNYLKQRSMIVRINGKNSEVREVSRGIPQGSILGPILYTIYVNQVFKYMKHCKMYMYADDTAMTVVHNELNVAMQLLQDDFNRFQLWIHDNELIINERKTKILCIKTPNKKKLIDINIKCHTYSCLHKGNYDGSCKCSVLEEVNNFKYLGLYLDNKFSWDTHVGVVVKKLRVCAAQFFKLKYILDFKNLTIVYNALVKSILLYGIQCYGQCTITNKIKIERLNNHIRKIITIKNYNDEPNNILTFNNLFTYMMIIEYYYREDTRTRGENKHNIRNNRYKIPITYNKYGDRKLEVIIPKIFNTIPMDLQKIKKISMVKKKIREWLVEKNV